MILIMFKSVPKFFKPRQIIWRVHLRCQACTETMDTCSVGSTTRWAAEWPPQARAALPSPPISDPQVQTIPGRAANMAVNVLSKWQFWEKKIRQFSLVVFLDHIRKHAKRKDFFRMTLLNIDNFVCFIFWFFKNVVLNTLPHNTSKHIQALYYRVSKNIFHPKTRKMLPILRNYSQMLNKIKHFLIICVQ